MSHHGHRPNVRRQGPLLGCLQQNAALTLHNVPPPSGLRMCMPCCTAVQQHVAERPAGLHSPDRAVLSLQCNWIGLHESCAGSAAKHLGWHSQHTMASGKAYDVPCILNVRATALLAAVQGLYIAHACQGWTSYSAAKQRCRLVTLVEWCPKAHLSCCCWYGRHTCFHTHKPAKPQ